MKGQYFLHWVDGPEVPWDDAFMVVDERIFSWAVAQSEGGACGLVISLRNQRGGGILNIAGGRVWAWFVVDCGSGGLWKGLFRLIGAPGGIVKELITLTLVSKPDDYEVLKRELAESLKQLPYYSRNFVDPQRALDDVDAVLEGYTKIWHVDRETLAVTVADEILPDDGVVILNAGDHLYEKFDMAISSAPVAKVTINALFNWTNKASGGGIDLGKWITDQWPNESPQASGVITSFTYDAGSWPKAGTTMGDGWAVTFASATPLVDTEVRHFSESGKLISTQGTNMLSQQWNWPNENESTEIQTSLSFDYLGGFPKWASVPAGSEVYGPTVTEDQIQVQYDSDGDSGDALAPGLTGLSGKSVSSFNRTFSQTFTVVPLLTSHVQMHVGFQAGRPFTEFARMVMVADVQRVFFDSPEEGPAIILPDLQTVDLSAPIIVDGSTTAAPIGNTATLSYLALDAGLDDLLYLLALGRAVLLKRARAVETTTGPLLELMPLITLRKSMVVNEDRIPNSTALGKITSYKMEMKNGSGLIETEVKMMSCIGRGGSHTLSGGEPLYVDAAYVDDEYQEFSGQQIAIDSTEDVALVRPGFDGIPDGLNFFSKMRAEDIVDGPIVFQFPPAEQRLHLQAYGSGVNQDTISLIGGGPEAAQQKVTLRNQGLTNALRQLPTSWTIKLKSLTDVVNQDKDIEVTELKVPKQVDLET